MAIWKNRKKYNLEVIETEGEELEKVEKERVKLTKFLKRELVLTMISVLTVTTVILGGSYAIFTNIEKAEKYNIIKTGTLQISYDDTSTGLGNIINLNGAYPESDIEGQKREAYRFKITNTGSLNAKYKVRVLDDTDMIEEDGCNDKQLEKTKIKYSLNQETPVILDSIKEEYIIKEGTLAPEESIILEMRMWIDENAGNEVLGTHYHGKIVVEGIQKEETAVETLLAKTNDAETSYDNATEEGKKEMFAFTHQRGGQQEGWSEEDLKDYRYVGTTPNNYVTFNDELWRIIGIFTVEDEKGTKEKRVKLIRDESIGTYSWDNKPNGTGSSDSEYGSNNWNDSLMQEVLNKGAYYNRTTGNCPYGRNGKTTPCDFNSTGLSDTAKNMIGKTKWYLGGITTPQQTASNAFIEERGTSVYNGRATNWIGEVGLMYPSDYGYAAGGEACLQTDLFSYNTNCQNNNWLFNTDFQWMITPLSSFSYYVFDAYNEGNVASNSTTIMYAGARPSVYLKSSVVITTGDGSRENPYQLFL